MVNFIFADVSRVFTHELVRHRVGVGISQESLRYVRLNNLKMWLPSVISENEEAVEIFLRTGEYLESIQVRLADLFELDDKEDVKDFHIKKTVTSAMRRIAPIGLSTSIGWSANFRTLRWVIENRTHPDAEEEIRLVFGKVGETVVSRYPNMFADFRIEMSGGLPHYIPESSKI
jgi:thymidylate synthase (FAD)